MYDYSYVWLIFGNNLSHSLQSLNDSGFSIVTDFAILLSNETDYVLYDVYNLCKMRGGVLNVTWLGSWREDDGLAINLTGSRINRRRNFNRLRAKAAGIVSSILERKTRILITTDNVFVGATQTRAREFDRLSGGRQPRGHGQLAEIRTHYFLACRRHV